MIDAVTGPAARRLVMHVVLCLGGATLGGQPRACGHTGQRSRLSQEAPAIRIHDRPPVIPNVLIWSFVGCGCPHYQPVVYSKIVTGNRKGQTPFGVWPQFVPSRKPGSRA